MFRNRTKITATVGKRTCSLEHSCAWYPQPGYRRAPAESGFVNAELSPAGD